MAPKKEELGKEELEEDVSQLEIQDEEGPQSEAVSLQTLVQHWGLLVSNCASLLTLSPIRLEACIGCTT
jgi:hypothetical protein